MASGTAVTEVPDDATFNDHINSFPSSTLIVIYFHAPWAAPCRQMSLVVNALAGTYSPTSTPSTAFLSVHAEELPETSEQYDITAVPLIVLQRDGKVLETISGSDAAKVRAAVERYAGAGNPDSNAEKGADLPPAQTVTKPAAGTNGTENGTATTSSELPSGPEVSSAGNVGDKDALLGAELQSRLEGLVKAAPVMLFIKGTPSAPQCGFSRKAVGLLREKSVRYGFFNILADLDVREGLKKFGDWPTFPQLWVDGDLVGGVDIMKEEFENNTDFLDEYSVNTKKSEAQPTSTAPEAATA